MKFWVPIVLILTIANSIDAQFPQSRYCIDNSTLAFTYEGIPSIVGTFVNCLKTVQDAMIAPYYDTGIKINVSTEIFLNNLINIDEVSTSVTMDFFFTTMWDDHRFQMPALWSAVENPSAFDGGVDISEAATITNVQGVQPLLWMPDMVFPDATSITKSAEYLKLYPSGQFRRMEHFVMTFSQSEMKFHDYPCDHQNITIRFFSYTLTAAQLTFVPVLAENGLTKPHVDFVYPQGSTEASFAQNPEWNLIGTDFQYVVWQLSPGFFPRPFGVATIKLKRQSDGVLQRLCMPILLIMLLCALSYWATVNDRIATTVTGLLAIAALYIAVIGAIPLVGYLTRLDEYMFIMFVIIFVNTILHMVVVRLNVAEKGKSWPLRKLTVRIIEFVGRVSMIPWIILTYMVCFWPAVQIPVVVIVLVLLGLLLYAMVVRYVPELKHTAYTTKALLEQKANAKGKHAQGLSSLEKRFLALYAEKIPISRSSGEQKSENNDAHHSGAIELHEVNVNPMNEKP